MKVLRFLFPIAFRLSTSGKKLTWNIVIHIAAMLMYYMLATVVFLFSLPIWFVLILIPIISAIFVIAFVAFVFILIIIGIIVPFYCVGGVFLGILNYKKELSVLDDIEDSVSDGSAEAVQAQA